MADHGDFVVKDTRVGLIEVERLGY